MPASKVANTTKIPEKKKETSNEKIYWIITDENQYVEVTESEITSNPAEYIGKEMFEKPKDQYEIVVVIKKKTKA